MRGRVGAVALFALAVAACNPPGPAARPYNGTDITGAELAPDLTLQDTSGRPRSAADFRGRLLLVYFGYTHCPDICPTTLADLAAAQKRLGPLRERIETVFVTLDPERDRGDELARFLGAFDPRFIGLRGDEAATARVAKQFRIYVEKHADKGDRPATLDHTSTVFVFDAAGKPRLMFGPGVTADQMAADLKRMLES